MFCNHQVPSSNLGAGTIKINGLADNFLNSAWPWVTKHHRLTMNQGPFQALKTYILSKVVTVFNSDSSAYAYYTVFFVSAPWMKGSLMRCHDTLEIMCFKGLLGPILIVRGPVNRRFCFYLSRERVNLLKHF